jgi:hypothetical protein
MVGGVSEGSGVLWDVEEGGRLQRVPHRIASCAVAGRRDCHTADCGAQMREKDEGSDKF